MTVDKLYSNPSYTMIAAGTIGTWPDYKLLVIVNATSTTAPSGTTLFLTKGQSGYGGTAWGNWYGNRQYTWNASTGALTCNGSSNNNVTPYLIYGIK